MTFDTKEHNIIAAAGEAVLSVLYPRRCPLCGKIVTDKDERGRSGRLAHPACLRKAPYIGKAYAANAGPGKGAHPHAFIRNYAVFAYEGTVKSALYGLKYKNKREYAAFFAQEALRMYGAELSALQIEAVVAVPLHKKRERVRGYNQAACIGVHVAEGLGVPFEKRLVRRIRNTAPQKALGTGERSANLRDAFCADARAGTYRCVLVVDDIYTTGSTLDAVSKVLLAAGCERIYTLTAAVGSLSAI